MRDMERTGLCKPSLHETLEVSLCYVNGGVKPGFTDGATDEFGLSPFEDRIRVHDLHAPVRYTS